ncbi:DUF5681 domain-containing protein [uncultured Lamprocystis sp.]|jgi:hypothetical protein|uniref:DUF5681 domain-containing protein n=1 Tax=uncultured Lamprocystis sp. TaxID=543132 RepID=UPI0025D9AE19|nr:DUF5681 domain-containing protein [uncultured Lamprocystis sp.]
MPFVKGKSGNPAGRKPGALTKQDKLRAQIAEGVPDILKAMQQKAEDGDTAAAKLLLDRVLPSLKTVDAPAPLALGTGPANLTGAATAVLAALASGSATPDQAASFAAVLASLARVKEVCELTERIEALERATTTTQKAP